MNNINKMIAAKNISKCKTIGESEEIYKDPVYTVDNNTIVIRAGDFSLVLSKEDTARAHVTGYNLVNDITKEMALWIWKDNKLYYFQQANVGFIMTVHDICRSNTFKCYLFDKIKKE